MRKTRTSLEILKTSIERRSILLGMFTAWLAVLSLVCTPYLFARLDYDSEQKKDQDETKQSLELKSALQGLAVTDLNEDEAILHTLNRLGFGPRPGDVERVRKMGLKKWIEQQLNPDQISDAATDARLEKYPTLKMSSAKLLAEFPQPNQAALQAVSNNVSNRDEVQDREKKLEQRRMAREERRKSDAASADPSEANSVAQKSADLNLSDKSGNDLGKHAALLEGNKPQRIVAELSMAKLIRAIYSERQLNEEMGDFWFNHFNVFFGKGADKWLLTSYERDVIRPHAMGKFKDLLLATAQSPAMLFYLDNFLSADPNSFARMQEQQEKRRGRFGRGSWGNTRFPQGRQAGQQGPVNGIDKQKKERGLNENYARELMELHTLGVDGGYTQADVIEVAKCFTGWTVKEPRREPEFFFNERIHDPNPKTVLGKTIHAGGIKDAEQVIEMLAHHPSTARFISTKLARHFVADNPPQALVERMTKTFVVSDGDVRAVLRTMIYSPEFWSRDAYRAKIKTPFELVVSAMRATGAQIATPPLPLVYWVGRIGEPLYLCQPPTGYSDRAETWVNTGALLSRLNFTLALAANRVRGSNVDPFTLLGEDAASDPKLALERATRVFLDGQVSPQTRQTLEQQLKNPQVLQASLDDPVKQIDIGVVAGLVLGTPEFQRR
ncbi:MAG TPA: DUF1800 domain-containing protein [Candidatus Dormibacteraeota bacterium]|nr:DUF1800 domain-containing protein [Candidatus Dormibacteraeota bacterium]